MKSEVKARSARAGTQSCNDVKIIPACMFSAHRGQNAIGSGLYRQMHTRHELRKFAVCRDEISVHVARVARGVAQAQHTGYVRKAPQQLSECRRPAIRSESVIGIHILADQRDLAHARFGQPRDLCDNLFNRARDFSTTRIGHDAERAELVASFLHRDESGNAAFGNRVSPGRGQNVELVLNRKFRVDDFFAALRALDHIRQAMIILRADNQVDRACPAYDFLAFGLCDATGHGDYHVTAVASGGLLHFADASDFRIDLLRGLFADVTGVEDDEIGILWTCSFDEAGRCQGVCHTM